MARRYRLGDPLGRGGMGQVWRAFDEVLGRDVAVKLLHPGLASEAVAARFRLEARAAARISNPHVVAVYDFGVDEDRLFLVMELVDGHSLAAQLRQSEPFSSQRTAEYVVQAARGLDSAHTHGVVHRDVKPSNLLLATDRTGAGQIVKIADFGIARVTDASVMTLTASGEIAGTSQYIAPERALGEPGGPPADVYSLGCVAYHLLTGKPPFHGDGPAAIAYQHVHGTPAPPRDLRPGVDDAFADLVLRMLAKDPDERPTAHQLAGWTPAAAAPVDVRQDAPIVPPILLASDTREDVEDSAAPPVPSTPSGRLVAARPILAAAAVGFVASVAVVWATLHPGSQAEPPPSTSAPTGETLPARVPSADSSIAPSALPSNRLPTAVAADVTRRPSSGPTTLPTTGSTPATGGVPTQQPTTAGPTDPPGPTGPTGPADPTDPTTTAGPTDPTVPPGTTAPTTPPTTSPTTPTPTAPGPTKPPKPTPTKPKPTKPH